MGSWLTCFIEVDYKKDCFFILKLLRNRDLLSSGDNLNVTFCERDQGINIISGPKSLRRNEPRIAKLLIWFRDSDSKSSTYRTLMVPLTTKLQQVQASEALIDRVPLEIQSFLEAFQSLEPRQQKAQLQTILKAATVYKDGRIELEFRE
jgi:hypothetical protein